MLDLSCKMMFKVVIELINCGKVELEVEWEEIELGLEKRAKDLKFSAEFGRDFGPAWTEIHDRTWTEILENFGPDFGHARTEILDRKWAEFLTKFSVMTSVQPGPKP